MMEKDSCFYFFYVGGKFPGDAKPRFCCQTRRQSKKKVRTKKWLSKAWSSRSSSLPNKVTVTASNNCPCKSRLSRKHRHQSRRNVLGTSRPPLNPSEIYCRTECYEKLRDSSMYSLSWGTLYNIVDKFVQKKTDRLCENRKQTDEEEIVNSYLNDPDFDEEPELEPGKNYFFKKLVDYFSKPELGPVRCDYFSKPKLELKRHDYFLKPVDCNSESGNWWPPISDWPKRVCVNFKNYISNCSPLEMYRKAPNYVLTSCAVLSVVVGVKLLDGILNFGVFDRLK